MSASFTKRADPSSLLLEFDIGEVQAKKIWAERQWKQALAASTATSLNLVAGHLLKTPGTPFVFPPAPQLGVMYMGNLATKALLPKLASNHVKLLIATSQQIISLQNLILGSLGTNVKSMLECNTTYEENDLKNPGEGKLHLLLKAIHEVCSTREGGTRETLTADLLSDIASLRMDRMSFSEFCEVVRAQCDAGRNAGFGISEAQEVVFVVRGLEGNFLPIKEALESAAAVSGNGLPTTRAALRAAAVRIEATLGNKVSAFSAKVDDQSKRRWDKDEKAIYDEGFKKGAKKGDARIKVLEEELDVAKLTIARLEKLAERTQKRAEKAKGATETKEEAEKQRVLPPGSQGKNVPRTKWNDQAPKKIREKHRAETEAYAASLQSEDDGSDSDSDYYS
jgi:hypothetical protein